MLQPQPQYRPALVRRAYRRRGIGSVQVLRALAVLAMDALMALCLIIAGIGFWVGFNWFEGLFR